ncbi:MAG: SDR family NAD(P)-dependent oxidoreductase [Nevskia sp.]|nr:SDR family NAD(P)-dependent oxidoreductase [Nevskia sp.]
MSFDNKVVLITGAAGALGRAVASAFAAAGATLALLDLNEQVLATAYPGVDGRRLLLAADLADTDSTRHAVDRAVTGLGRIDCLCNIAGGFDMGPAVHETSQKLWDAMLGVNAGTLLNAVRAVVPGMIAAGHGSIVNVGAGAGQSGRAHMGAYSAAKSVVIRLTEAMAAELREQGINVNCVLPSIIDTPRNRTDMPKADYSRWVAPQDLAHVIRFLCSEDARAVHGAAIPVNGLS